LKNDLIVSENLGKANIMKRQDKNREKQPVNTGALLQEAVTQHESALAAALKIYRERGRKCLEKLLARDPKIRVVIASGYFVTWGKMKPWRSVPVALSESHGRARKSMGCFVTP